MELNPKESKLGIEKIDRISELPDSILSLILCNLPTKNAIGTSILSTKWKNLNPFEAMPIKLNLDDSMLLSPNRGENNNSNNTPCVNFMDFVDKLLNFTLSDANSVEEMILNCDKDYGEHKVASWVSAAIRLHVRHLDLKFAVIKSMALFHSLNGCATLVTLRLWFESECCPPDNFNLPNLKTLYLAKLIFNDDDEGEPINQLLLGCPTLEYLHLFQCNLKNLYDVSIKCPVLKKLAIENCWEQFLGHLTIDAPNLEVLIYDGFLATFYDVCDFSSLHTARMGIRPSRRLLNLAGENHDGDDLWWDFNNSTAMFVSRCSSTIRLYLSDRAIDGLHRSSMQLPIFHNLMWLSLGCLHWSILARLLQIAPNLEYLIIEEVLQDNEEGFQNFRHLLPIPPECLLFHVKSFEFHMFEGDEDDIKLVEYFLKNGEVLQNLILHCLPSVDMRILARLRMLPRQSTTCQIDCKILHEMNI